MIKQALKKQDIRQVFNEKRKQLSPNEYDKLNMALLAQFKKLDLSAVKCLHIFLPIKSRREPNTYLLIDWLKTHHPEIKIVFPKTDFTDNSMTHYINDERIVIQLNAYEIPEPVAGHTIDVKEIDMVMIPLLAFDRSGFRVGYGKGFYDRFLLSCRLKTVFIGLSLFDPVEEIEDVKMFDVKMHGCLTPERTWRF